MQSVRVLSYNVRYFGHATRGIASTAKAMRGIAKAIAALDPLPDIICLQEVETQSLRSTVAHPASHPDETQLERFMEMLTAALALHDLDDSYAAHYFPAHAYRIAKGAEVYTTGLAVIAHDRCVVDHHNARAPADITHRRKNALAGFKQTRICAHVRFRRRGGKAIDLFNTHMSLPSTLSRNFWTKPRRMGWGPNQLEEAKNLARFVDAQRASDRFIVCGDFNALPGSPVHHYLANECGFVDGFATRNEMSEDDLLAWPTAGFMRMRMHLDHVFSGPALRWVDFDGSARFGDRAGAFHGLSDHVPLIGTCVAA
jgi:endonuclease/exonuclease/phosphatase family metal-dependent hydrolase